MSQQLPDARELLRRLVGRTITTVTGRPNTVLELRGDQVIAATGRSPAGTLVPIEWVQNGLERLVASGDVEVSVDSLGHRSAFVSAVLLTLPGAMATATTPPHIVLRGEVGNDYRRDMAGELNIWWQDAEEFYWLEITDRPDVGVDLHAPQRDASGKRTPGYSLIWWVKQGDVVFHYDLNERAVTAWSRAVGQVVEAPVVWLSHRAATRRRIGTARMQPGWWLDLEGPYPLDRPVTLTDLRSRSLEIRAALDEPVSATAVPSTSRSRSTVALSFVRCSPT